MSVPVTSDYNIKYFAKSKTATIKHFQQIFTENRELNDYIPDGCKLARIPKAFLFTLLKTINSSLYDSLKNLSNQEKTSKRTKLLEKTYIEVEQEIIDEIANVPILILKLIYLFV